DCHARPWAARRIRRCSARRGEAASPGQETSSEPTQALLGSGARPEAAAAESRPVLSSSQAALSTSTPALRTPRHHVAGKDDSQGASCRCDSGLPQLEIGRIETPDSRVHRAQSAAYRRNGNSGHLSRKQVGSPPCGAYFNIVGDSQDGEVAADPQGDSRGSQPLTDITGRLSSVRQESQQSSCLQRLAAIMTAAWRDLQRRRRRVLPAGRGPDDSVQECTMAPVRHPAVQRQLDVTRHGGCVVAAIRSTAARLAEFWVLRRPAEKAAKAEIADNETIAHHSSSVGQRSAQPVHKFCLRWQVCAANGQVLVQLMHKRKCPRTEPAVASPGTGEAIVDGLDAKRSQKLMLRIGGRSAWRCSTGQKILAQPQQSGKQKNKGRNASGSKVSVSRRAVVQLQPKIEPIKRRRQSDVRLPTQRLRTRRLNLLSLRCRSIGRANLKLAVRPASAASGAHGGLQPLSLIRSRCCPTVSASTFEKCSCSTWTSMRSILDVVGEAILTEAAGQDKVEQQRSSSSSKQETVLKAVCGSSSSTQQQQQQQQAAAAAARQQKNNQKEESRLANSQNNSKADKKRSLKQQKQQEETEARNMRKSNKESSAPGLSRKKNCDASTQSSSECSRRVAPVSGEKWSEKSIGDDRKTTLSPARSRSDTAAGQQQQQRGSELRTAAAKKTDKTDDDDKEDSSDSQSSEEGDNGRRWPEPEGLAAVEPDGASVEKRHSAVGGRTCCRTPKTTSNVQMESNDNDCGAARRHGHRVINRSDLDVAKRESITAAAPEPAPRLEAAAKP
uniref:RING-type domain-containing protein n=1 Tax=Macrostomum lignano TaxID=282301 RepID=A0A1I8F4P7_9PLAT